MNITETPDKWVVLKIDNYYKLFASWIGDSWKINSGITKIEEDEDNYYFFGFSGSCYKCYKKSYGVATSYSSNILNRITTTTDKIFILDEKENWIELLKKNV